MKIGIVVGSVVATIKDSKMNGSSLLLVVDATPDGTQISGRDPFVALDTVGAGRGEIVMVTSGSSARDTSTGGGTPIDAAIIGIIDSLELQGEFTYKAT